MIGCVHLTCFTTWFNDPYFQYYIGWSFIGFTMLVILLNAFLILKEALYETYWSIHLLLLAIEQK